MKQLVDPFNKQLLALWSFSDCVRLITEIDLCPLNDC